MSYFSSQGHKGSVLDPEASSRDSPGDKTSTITGLPDSLSSFLSSRESFPPQHISSQGCRDDTTAHTKLLRCSIVWMGVEYFKAYVDSRREKNLKRFATGVICLIKIIRSVVREDCTVSAQSGIALFLQTDTLFPALSLAGAGSSREAVAWELCSTPGWQKQ